MAKELKDYLHFYIGGICRNVETNEDYELTPEVYQKIISGELNAKPVLHNWHTKEKVFFDKMQELDERLKIETGYDTELGLKYPNSFCDIYHNHIFFLLKEQYDYFKLIDEGLAFLNMSSEAAIRNYIA